MLRFTGSLLFVSSLAVQAVMAFPLQPTPAANIQVSPLIPSPTEQGRYYAGADTYAMCIPN